VIVWTPWFTNSLVTKVISGLGIISTFTDGIGNTVVTELAPSDIVWIPTSDVGLTYWEIGVTVSIEVTLLEPIWLSLSE
jgi:hypothetical protein